MLTITLLRKFARTADYLNNRDKIHKQFYEAMVKHNIYSCKLTCAFIFIFIFAFAARPVLAGDASLLDGNAIDLLVGTPSGVSEPLDERRSSIATNAKHDFSNLLDYDQETNEDIADISWNDAEDNKDKPQQKTEYLDLISEISDDEIEDDEYERLEDTFDNSSDSVETKIKL